MIPFDRSVVIPPLPALSTIDLGCVAALPLFFIRWKQLGPSALVQRHRAPFLFSWTLFIAWGCLCVVVKDGSFRSILRWGEFTFVYLMAVTIHQNEARPFLQRVALCQETLTALLASAAICQFFVSHANYRQVYATFLQNNIFAAYMNLILPVSLLTILHGRKKIGGRLRFTIPIGIAYALSYSRGAWLSLVSALYAAITSRFTNGASSAPATLKKRYRGFFVAIAVFLLAGITMNLALKSKDVVSRPLWSSNGRMVYLQAGYRLLRVAPWMGIGPGNYKTVLPTVLSEDWLKIFKRESKESKPGFWQHLHNMYLQVAVEYGLIGLCLWLVAMAALLAPTMHFLFREDLADAVCCGFAVSLLVFMIHNTVDILFVSSLDLFFVGMAAVLGTLQGVRKYN